VNPDVASPAEAANRDTTAGGIDSSVPNQYRRRVGQYFQRIADEARKGR
jgi:hypothetical protein